MLRGEVVSHRMMALLLLLAIVAADIGAQTPIRRSPTGLPAPTSTISFNSTALDDGDIVGDALRQDQGVRFNGAVYLEGGNPNNPFGIGTLSNGFSAEPIASEISMLFDRPVTSIAFNLFAIDLPGLSETVFQAWSGGKRVSEFEDTPQDPFIAFGDALSWWGFAGGEFDEVRIVAPAFTEAGAPDVVFALWLTNIQIVQTPVVTTVPEPAMIVLVGSGLLALGIARRRRRTY